MKTLAAILVEQRHPLEIAEITLPEELDYGQLRVRLLASGICGSQLGEIDGVKGPDAHLPHLLGHEGLAVVEAVGRGVSTVAVDDRVVLHWRKGAGIEAPTPRYTWDGRTVKAGWVTTFNHRAVVSENRATRVPSETSPALGALLGCALTTGFGAVGHDAGVRPGEALLVFGAGGVGLSAVIAGALTHAYPIIAVDPVVHKLELARRFGAHVILDPGRDNLAAALARVLGKHGADAVIETTGKPQAIESAYEFTSKSGRTVLVGVPPVGAKASLHTLPLHFEQRLLGSHGGGCEPSRDIPRYLGLANRGAFDPIPMIDHRCTLSEINGAIASLRSGEATKCLVTFGE